MSVEKLNTMNERMQREMDKLWDSGLCSEEKLEAMKTEHCFTYEACNKKYVTKSKNAGALQR